MSERAIFAAGCFWGIEEAFRRLDGVLDVRVGYTGGHRTDPTYETVCSGTTGHAEAVEVTFDPAHVSFDRLLDQFWQLHDPTQLNRQGPDRGTQYRSAIFTADEAQLAAARASRDRLVSAGTFSRPVVTEITPASEFWPAEDYHQQYLKKRRGRFF